MMQFRKIISFVCIITPTLAGCDMMYGVNRSAKLQSFPSLDCIHDVIATAPGVTFVKRSEDRGGKAITLSGLKDDGTTYTFWYHGSETFPYTGEKVILKGHDVSRIAGDLQVHQDHRGIIWFSQTLYGLNERPPQETVDSSRPVMRWIEQALAQQCGIAQLSEEVRESCNGVTCPPLQ
jgi:hypothetical protein